MRIAASAPQFRAEIEAWLKERIEEKAQAILHGVPVHVYRERCAELRAFQAVHDALPDIEKRAIDK